MLIRYSAHVTPPEHRVLDSLESNLVSSVRTFFQPLSLLKRTDLERELRGSD